MSYDNTQESNESQSVASSVGKYNAGRPGRLGMMRGTVLIFNHYFPKTGKRMPKNEKARRWRLYKHKILETYGRVIKSKHESEKARIIRYSQPLDYLKV